MDVGLVPGESAVHEVLKRRDSRYSAGYTEAVSGAPDANEPEGLVMVPLDEVVAVASARPTPTSGALRASGLTDEEWDAFIEALTDG